MPILFHARAFNSSQDLCIVSFSMQVPTQISQCTRLLRLDLCRNALQSIPPEVVQLPMLRNLNLSRNQLRELPECSWSSSLAILDVSANELNVLPRGLQDTTMLSLNIRNNRFVEVGLLLYEESYHL